ncbi:EndoU domain-containing protein [Actinokineospora sp. UTMC 2448]|uniref:EndoU domain-containing protein n=1 Tax=Actinokineospora sp. UTMC 2448 TaxID=2268449 RepID=UPI002164EEB4|nr:EndoU domain-containing protein [Actinokineospora sp. UTMC 2448]UVS81431.1 hypothetical protein Actkin_05189 [Actinokineospora sp. UTMC 2448]
MGALDEPDGHGEPGSIYAAYGYAGLIWHDYTGDCLSFGIDTGIGNTLLNTAKLIIGATNGLYYTITEGGLLAGVNAGIADAAQDVFDNIYGQFFGLAALLLAVSMFRHIWRGNLATTAHKGTLALAAMMLAATGVAAAASFPAIDRAITTATNAFLLGFAEPEHHPVARHELPTRLHTEVIYHNWLRGTLGDPEQTPATDYGPKVLAAQAYSAEEINTGADTDPAPREAKQAQYEQIAEELGTTTDTFTGDAGSRTGIGVLALLHALAFALFQLLAAVAIAFAHLALRLLVVGAPVIGVVAVFKPDILPRIGRAIGATAFTIFLLAILAGIHHRVLGYLTQADLDLLPEIIIVALLSWAGFYCGKPIQRTAQIPGTLRLQTVEGPLETAGENHQPSRTLRARADRLKDRLLPAAQANTTLERPEGQAYWQLPPTNGADGDQPPPIPSRKMRYIPESTWRHILYGDPHYLEDRLPSGYHRRPDGKDHPNWLTTDISRPNKKGVYQGRVYRRELDRSNWKMKENTGRENTFFPDDWSEDQIKHAVTTAYHKGKLGKPKKNKHGKWRGKWKGRYRGIEIAGYYDAETGALMTAWPCYGTKKSGLQVQQKRRRS